MHRLSQFPTPYPDECYYSILCRYYQRMGYISFDKTMESLFGGTHHTDLFILMPYLASHVNDWVESGSGIDAESITWNHTAFAYCTLADWWWYKPAEVKYNFWIGKKNQHIGFRDVKKEKLCYCAACAAEERQKYGEPYWHRLHQIKGVSICPKHGTKLYVSRVSFLATKRNFYPASCVLKKEEAVTFPVTDSLKTHRIQIASDIAWILDNGKMIRSNYFFRGLMKQYLLKKGYKLEQDKKGNIYVLLNFREFEEFYIDKQNRYIFNDSIVVRNSMKNPYFALWGFDYFRPFDILMLMEYLEGSAERFYSYF